MPVTKGTTGARRESRQRPAEDTALRSLSKEDRARLGMDSWEPSLLRQLLTAHNKLEDKNKN